MLPIDIRILRFINHRQSDSFLIHQCIYACNAFAIVALLFTNRDDPLRMLFILVFRILLDRSSQICYSRESKCGITKETTFYIFVRKKVCNGKYCEQDKGGSYLFWQI